MTHVFFLFDASLWVDAPRNNDQSQLGGPPAFSYFWKKFSNLGRPSPL